MRSELNTLVVRFFTRNVLVSQMLMSGIFIRPFYIVCQSVCGSRYKVAVISYTCVYVTEIRLDEINFGTIHLDIILKFITTVNVCLCNLKKKIVNHIFNHASDFKLARRR